MIKRKLPTWLHSLAILTVTLGLGLIDWQTGHEINFFVFYFLPVSMAAWYVGLSGGIIAAVLCGVVWAGADALSGHKYPADFYAVWNTTIRLISFLAIGSAVAKIKTLLDQEREISATLRKTLSEIKVLETFLPICAQCKKIRNEQGVWQHLEVYIGQHSGTQFSHGYCPQCAKRAMEEAGLIDEKTEPQGRGYSPPATRSSKPTP